MRLTKHPLIRFSGPGQADDYLPGFRVQAILIEALEIEASEAVRLMIAEAEKGALVARCLKRTDMFTSRTPVPEENTIVTRQLRPIHQQEFASVHPEDWAALRAYIDLHSDGSADHRLDWARWSFRFYHEDALGNVQHTTLESVDFEQSGIRHLVEAFRRSAGREMPLPVGYPRKERRDDRPNLSDSDLNRWWADYLSGEANANANENEVVAAVRAAYPGNAISRERIRKLRGKQKRGPKPFRGKMSAE